MTCLFCEQAQGSCAAAGVRCHRRPRSTPASRSAGARCWRSRALPQPFSSCPTPANRRCLSAPSVLSLLQGARPPCSPAVASASLSLGLLVSSASALPGSLALPQPSCSPCLLIPARLRRDKLACTQGGSSVSPCTRVLSVGAAPCRCLPVTHKASTYAPVRI